MKAAVFKEKGLLAIEDIPLPNARSGEVVIKVSYCGICGSDVRLFSEGFFPVGLTIGHEFCGTIHEIGPDVDGWSVGDRVTVMPAVICRNCQPCLRGEGHHCIDLKFLGMNEGMPGAFAEYVTANASMLHSLPDEVTDEEAANIEPCAVSLRAVNRSGIQVGDSVVIFGAGSIGLFVLQIARIAGASSIYVIEPAPSRSHAAIILGADEVFDPSDTTIFSKIANLTGGGADVAFMCSAAPPVLQQAVDTVKCQGKVIVVGAGLSANVIPEIWMWKEIEVKGSFAYLGEFPLALDLFKQGKVKVEGMISDMIPLENVQQALLNLAQPTSQIKVLVRPNQ